MTQFKSGRKKPIERGQPLFQEDWQKKEWEANKSARQEIILTEEEIKLDLLQEYENEKKKRTARILKTVGAFAILFPTSIAIGSLLRFPIIVAISSSVFGSFTVAFAISESQKKTMSELTIIEDIKVVGALCEILDSDILEFKLQAGFSLAKLLPRLTANDARLLRKKHKEVLRRQLARRMGLYDPNFFKLQISILKAFEQIGEKDDLELVESLVDPAQHVFDSRVREAALECLPYLRARVADMDAKNILLRASSSTTLGTSELLRPAKSEEDSNPSTLLRPSEKDGTSQVFDVL